MFTWNIYPQAEPYERNGEEVTCSPSIGFMTSRFRGVELIRKVYSEISRVPYINHLYNEDLEQSINHDEKYLNFRQMFY